jgi:hypothetical protein
MTVSRMASCGAADRGLSVMNLLTAPSSQLWPPPPAPAICVIHDGAVS